MCDWATNKFKKQTFNKLNNKQIQKTKIQKTEKQTYSTNWTNDGLGICGEYLCRGFRRAPAIKRAEM